MMALGSMPGIPAIIERRLGDTTGDKAPTESLRRLVAEGLLALPLPGAGATLSRWKALALLGEHDLALARLAEGHADAAAILAEAGVPAPGGSVLGVWAAGPVENLTASPAPDGGWQLRGIRRWCSGAGTLSHALVRGAVDEEEMLFFVPLDQTGIQVIPGTWSAAGMAASDTLDVRFDGARCAVVVGPPGFYVERLGFWLGSMGVAAVWVGGARGVSKALAHRGARGDNPHTLAHMGAVESVLWSLDACLASAAQWADEHDGCSQVDLLKEAEMRARMLRYVVERGAEEVITRVGRATGAGPLSHDADHAQRVTDLTVYLRQSHAESDLAALGRRLLNRNLFTGNG